MIVPTKLGERRTVADEAARVPEPVTRVRTEAARVLAPRASLHGSWADGEAIPCPMEGHGGAWRCTEGVWRAALSPMSLKHRCTALVLHARPTSGRGGRFRRPCRF